MTKREKVKKGILSVIFWGATSISFLFFAALIILKANGFQLNWQTWELKKTGMIVLDGEPQDVDIRVNQKYLKNLPEVLDNLAPGPYSIAVSKNGFKTWQKDFQVESGQAIGDENIVLFLENPFDLTLPENITSDKIISDYQKKSADLTILDTEIYLNEKLITRFTSKILAATEYSDNRHIVYQIDNFIKIMDNDGQNQFTLAELTTSEPSTWMFRDNGRTFIYIDNGKMISKIIR